MDSSNNIFTTENRLQSYGKLVNGIPAESKMYNNNNNSINARAFQSMLVDNAVPSQSLSNIPGDQMQAGVIQAVSIIIGQFFRVAQDGTLTASAGNISNWSIAPSVLSSSNGNIVFDAANNNLTINSSGIPQIVIQG